MVVDRWSSIFVETKWNLNEGPNFTPKNVMEVKPPLTLYFIPLDNPPLLTLLLLPTTTTMSSTLSHSMENDLIDNAFFAMMLPLLEQSQKVSKPRQSRNIDREEGQQKRQDLQSSLLIRIFFGSQNVSLVYTMN